MTSRERLLSLGAAAKKRGGLDLLVRYNPVPRRAAERVMEAFRAADLTARHHLSERLAANVVKAARRTRYGAAQDPKLTKWPTLNGATLRDRPNDFVVPGPLRIPAATGGTGGMPVRLCRSFSSVAAEQAFLDDMLRPLGMSWASNRVATLRPHATKSTLELAPPFGVWSHSGQRLTLSAPHLSAATLPWFLQTIDAFRPDILWATPTTCANLMVLMHRTGDHLQRPIPVVLTSSARLEASLRQQMERQWGARVVDYYSQAERVCLAVSHCAGEFWFQPAYGKVELIPDRVPAEDGQSRAAVLATGFWNAAMPLVRYHTGDYAIVPRGASVETLEAIALGVQPFLGVAGRSDEYLITPDGTRVAGLNCIPWEVANLLQAQIVQEAVDDVRVRVLTLPRFSETDGRKLEANARAKIPTSMRIRIETVQELEVGPHGKTPFVIRRPGKATISATSRVRESEVVHAA
ncbi:MAG: hypothetical protein JOZ42_14995 [Acetobacteraceae bacterium]|nr:hypothetical protein [Acetobacteraceae bacterium]